MPISFEICKYAQGLGFNSANNGFIINYLQMLPWLYTKSGRRGMKNKDLIKFAAFD